MSVRVSIRNGMFVVMCAAFVTLMTSAKVRADEEVCYTSGYNCSSTCSGQTCADICAQCGDGYVPAAGGGTPSCGAVGAGKCDFECGLGTCYGYSCGCRPPLYD